MTPLKWYEQICITISFTPFRWRLTWANEPGWGTAHISIGPIWASVGYPTKDALQQS